MINSRNKGAAGERELSEFLRSRNFDARRGQQYHGGGDSPDVVSDALSDFHIECKRVEKGNPYYWLEQAERDAQFSRIPVVMHRRSRKGWIAILDLQSFLMMVRELKVNAERIEALTPVKGGDTSPVRCEPQGEGETPPIQSQSAGCSPVGSS